MNDRAKMIQLQSKVACAITRAADETGRDRDLDMLAHTIRTNEKEHRAFGRRLVGASATKRHATVGSAVNHFLCKTIHEGIETYLSGEAHISSLLGVREDFVRAAILCSDTKFVDAMFRQIAAAGISEESPREILNRAASADYCEVIAS